LERNDYVKRLVKIWRTAAHEAAKPVRLDYLKGLAARAPMCAGTGLALEDANAPRENRTGLPRRYLLRQHFDQNRSTHRVTNENRSVPQRLERFLKRWLPRGIARFVFMRHPRIVDLVAPPKLSP